MRKPLFTAIIAMATTATFAQDYSLFSLPLPLITNANVVKRNEHLEIIIKSPSKAIVRHSYALTILNSKGESFADFYTHYNSFYSVESIDGQLYDKMGKELKHVKKKDIADLASEYDVSVSDTRFKQHSFACRDYPYTVAYSQEQEVSTLFNLPYWRPQGSMTMAVQQSKCSVTFPKGYLLRYKSYGYEGNPSKLEKESTITYSWEISQRKAAVREPYMPSWDEIQTKVVFAPSVFEIEGITGKMNTWKDFGSFIYGLKTGKDALPEAFKQKVHQVADAVKDPKEKIRVLYEYMQNNTRYISIQLGIGGWRPFEATEVASKGYGDCKALSNFMFSMLKEVGIPSRYVIINSEEGDKYLDTSFVCNQFDHVILCVPFKKDTVWLECTSNTLPPGYLGKHTDGRFALIVDEDGGTLVSTPTYAKNENQQLRNIQIKVDENGDATAQIQTKYTALQQDDLHDIINGLSSSKVKESLQESLSLPTYEVANFSYKQKKGTLPEVDEQLALSVTSLAQVSGKRMFISPNIMNVNGRKLNKDSVRVFDIDLGYDYKDIDTVIINVPAGYQLESLPKPVTIASKFGIYKMEVSYDNGVIKYLRSIEQNNGRFPATDYNELADYFSTIYKSDRARVVLKKIE